MQSISSKLNNWKNKTCILKFNITEKLNPPIYLYYQLDNFYLNHRALVKSKIWGQLTGEENIVYINLNLSKTKIYVRKTTSISNAKMLNTCGKYLIMIPQNIKATQAIHLRVMTSLILVGSLLKHILMV